VAQMERILDIYKLPYDQRFPVAIFIGKNPTLVMFNQEAEEPLLEFKKIHGPVSGFSQTNHRIVLPKEQGFKIPVIIALRRAGRQGGDHFIKTFYKFFVSLTAP